MDVKFQQTFRWFNRIHYAHDIRIPGTLGFLGPNEWGSFHTIYALFLMGLFMIDKHVWRRVAYAVLIAGSTYCLMYSYSRGAYVGLVVGLFFIALVKSRKLLIPLIVLFVVWKSILPTSVVERIEGTFVDQGNLEQVAGADVVAVGGAELTTTGRKQLWDQALDYFRESPATGIGFRTFSHLTGMDTHNVYIKFLAEQGIIGLFIYLWLYFLALRSGWQLYRGANEQLVKAFSFAFLCAVVGSIIVNYFGDRWTYLQIGGLYWIFWALVDQEYSMLKAKETTAALEGTTRTTANA
jgi:O-antigen ligase